MSVLSYPDKPLGGGVKRFVAPVTGLFAVLAVVVWRIIVPALPLPGVVQVSPEDFPYVVPLTVSLGHDSVHCSGSIIADHWILTARHCLTDGDTIVPPSAVSVRGGQAVDRIETDAASDLGLLYLTAPAGIKPVSLAQADPPVNAQLSLVGWGCLKRSTADCHRASGALKVGSSTLQPDSRCGFNDAAATRLCTVRPGSGSVVRHGDSGGSVLYRHNGRTGLVAVIYGYDGQKDDVSIAVPAARSWIIRTIR